MRFALIMAGGSGTRLWPLSRRTEPKQLLRLIGGRSLLQLAAERVDGVIPRERRLVCAAEALRDRVLADLPWLGRDRFLGEPEGRDTLNAVGFAAAVLMEEHHDATLVVLTADHLIEPREEFLGRLEIAFRLVESDPMRLVTFGVAPTFPAIGFGYVERGDPIAGMEGAFEATRFVEKPERVRAEQFLASGRFSWNSGMFVFRAATILDAIDRYAPASSKGLREIAGAWSTPARQEVIARVYPTLPKKSIDHGVLEPASRDAASHAGAARANASNRAPFSMAVVPMSVRWLDVGSWPALAETLVADADGNRASGSMAVHLASRGVTVIGDDPAHLVATIGCEDLIVVRTGDATLVCRAADAERVKELVALVPPERR